MTAIKVFCVDDSHIMLAKLKQMIEAMPGFMVCGMAQSGEDALKRYPELEPDVVTMDITMLGMDGIETVKQLMQTYESPRIVMVTSHGQERMVFQALKAGARGYVMKPLDAKKLSEHLNNALK